MNKKEFVFVYGTLKRGGRLNNALTNKYSGYACEGTLSKDYTMYIPTEDSRTPFPMLMEEDQGLNCKGEVYRVHPFMLEFLDEIEGAPDLYKRIEVDVTTNEGGTIRAYTYLFNEELPNDMEPSTFFNCK